MNDLVPCRFNSWNRNFCSYSAFFWLFSEKWIHSAKVFPKAHMAYKIHTMPCHLQLFSFHCLYLALIFYFSGMKLRFLMDFGLLNLVTHVLGIFHFVMVCSALMNVQDLTCSWECTSMLMHASKLFALYNSI